MSAVVIACVVMVATHVGLQYLWHRRMDGHRKLLVGQRDVQYLQAKQFQRELTSTLRATAAVSDECARMIADSRQLHGIAQDMVREVRGNG